MKKLLIALVMLTIFSTAAAAQDSSSYKIVTEIGQGMRFQGFEKPLIYTFSASFKPSRGFWNDRAQFGTSSMVIYYDTEVELYNGPRVAYRVLNTNLKTLGEDFNLMISGEALWGTSGRKLFGGGVIANVDPIAVGVSIYQEYVHKEMWINGNIGINLDNYLK